MRSILVIHIWIGKLPNYFHIWRRSCENNPTIDFLLCTDQNVSESSNFFVQKTDLNNLRERAADFLNFDVALQDARKLCDFKGIFGYMFNEWTEKYDFWGYCDSDLIFGDIRAFLTDEILHTHDYILGMGHFHIQSCNLNKFHTVLESATGMGKIGYWTDKLIPENFTSDIGSGYKIVYTDPKNHIFDEFPYGIAAKYLELYPNDFWTGYSLEGRCFDEPDERICSFRDMFNDDKRYTNSYYRSLAPYFSPYSRNLSDKKSFRIAKSVIYLYDNNKLYKYYNSSGLKVEKKEILYVHFIHRQMRVKVNNLDKFIIIPNKFIPCKKIDLLRLILAGLRFDHKYMIYAKKFKNRIKKWTSR